MERIKNYKAAVAGPEETHENLSDGINSIADLLAPTLGPVGGHVVHERDGTRGPELLNDAATAVRRILSLGDPRVDVGAMLMRHIVWRVAGQVGDGGTATALLTREIYRQALKMLTAGIGYRELEIGLQAATAAVRQELSDMASPVETEDDLALVALTVVKDHSLAATIGELSYLLGRTRASQLRSLWPPIWRASTIRAPTTRPKLPVSISTQTQSGNGQSTAIPQLPWSMTRSPMRPRRLRSSRRL